MILLIENKLRQCLKTIKLITINTTTHSSNNLSQMQSAEGAAMGDSTGKWGSHTDKQITLNFILNVSIINSEFILRSYYRRSTT